MLRLKSVPTEKEMLRALTRGDADLSPLTLTKLAHADNQGANGILVLEWQKQIYRFAVECLVASTPRFITAAITKARRNSSSPRSYPLILAPYLPDSQIAVLKKEQASGIDLCGNVFINVPGKILVCRTGSPNKFVSTGVIRNVYRKNSSLVARAFLIKPRYGSIGELLEEIKGRGGNVTQATVSKVCNSLDQDLVIERKKGDLPKTKTLRLIQPEKLIELLRTNYELPTVRQRIFAKSGLSLEELTNKVVQWSTQAKGRVVFTGVCSTASYAVMAREDKSSFYCSDAESLFEWLKPNIEETPRFSNVELIESEDEVVYFDTRRKIIASPIQAYLELARGDKREQETARQIEKAILGELK